MDDLDPDVAQDMQVAAEDFRTAGDVGTGSLRIELSSAQVSEISRQSAEAGHLASLIAGPAGRLEALAAGYREKAAGDAGLSSSLMVGLLVLASFPEDGALLANADVARTLGLQPSTAHRYVSTLVVVGLLEKDPVTRKYRLTSGYLAPRYRDANHPATGAS